MKLNPLPIRGALLIEPNIRSDERGFFLRTFDADTLSRAGVEFIVRQSNLSGNLRRGTFRGLHWQDESAPEAKLIQCIRGAIFDVFVDMDPSSPTYLESHGVELSASNRRVLYVPPLCAHGYLTLSDDAEAFYSTDAPYVPEAERGIRHDDPVVKVDFPIDVAVLSAKDESWPSLSLR